MYRCALWHWIEELIENSFIFIGSEYSGCLRHTYCQALLAFLIGTATAVSLYIPKCSDSLISGQHQAGCQEPVAQCWGAVQHCSGGDGSGSWCSVGPGFTPWISTAPKCLREVCVSTDSAWSSLSMCLHLSLSLQALRCCETKYDRANYSPNCEYINFSMVISNIVLISDFCI